MAMFHMQTPDGRVFEMDAPDATTAAQAFSQFAGVGAPNAPASAKPAVAPAQEDPAYANGQTPWGADNTFFGGVARGIHNTSKYMNDLTRVSQDSVSGGWADKLWSALSGGPVEAERAKTEQALQNTGTTGQVAKYGSMLALPAMLENAGLTATSALPEAASLVSRIGATAADGAIQGAIQGGGEDDKSTLGGALTGGLLGGTIGGAIPVAGKAIGLLGGNRLASALFPDTAAATKLGEVFNRAKMTPEDLAKALQAAKDDGQGVMMAADALGPAGQRLLAGVVRQPGEMRAEVTQALLDRQMDQGRRVAGSLIDAAGTPMTAQQYEQMLQATRATEAARNYAPVAADTKAIDVSDPVAIANRAISPAADNLATATGAVPTDLASRALIEAAERQIKDPIRAAVADARSYLASDGLTVVNVEKAFRAKTNIDQMIADATANNQGAKVAALVPVRDALDEALARTSPEYATARDAYRSTSNVIDAVDQGRVAATGRARPEDTIAMMPAEQAQQDAFRVGYFDPKITAALNTRGQMTNAARPLLSPAQSVEFDAFAAPGQADLLRQRLGREMTMHDTMTQALGGSRTAENLKDIADVHNFDPGILADLAKGHFGRALVSGLSHISDHALGNNAKVVDRLAKALTETSPAGVLARAADAKAKATIADQKVKALTRALMSGSISGIETRQ